MCALLYFVGNTLSDFRTSDGTVVNNCLFISLGQFHPWIVPVHVEPCYGDTNE